MEMPGKKHKPPVRKTEKGAAKRPRVDRVVTEAFQETVRELRKMSGKSNAPKLYDFTGEVRRRRESAVSAYLGIARSRWGEKYPELNIEEEWAYLCSAMGYTVRGLDGLYYISFASALWILDALEEAGNLKRAVRYFPEEKASLLYLPDFFEPCYPDDMIRQIIYLLWKQEGADNVFNGYINPVTAARREPVQWREPGGEPDQWGNRERLCGIMALIPPTKTERAVQRFEDKIWDFLDQYFACIARFAVEEQSHLKKSEHFFEQCRELGGELGFPWWDEDEDKSPKFAWAKPVAEQETVFPPLFPDKVRRGEVQRLEAIIRTGLAEESEAEKWEQRRGTLAKTLCSLPMLEGKQLQDWQQRFDVETAQLLRSFTVEDPYETCFAFLGLMESGRDLPWLYTPTVAVLTAAAAKLPWASMKKGKQNREDGKDMEREDSPAGGFEGANGEATLEKDLEEPPADWSEEKAALYALKYTPAGVSASSRKEDFIRYRNLPQLVYTLSGLVMPRGVWKEDRQWAEQLIQSGIPEDRAAVWSAYLQLAGKIQRKNRDALPLDVDMAEFTELCDDDNEMLAAEGNQKTEAYDPALLKGRVQQLETKVSELQEALYKASKESERRQGEVERVRAESANEHQELLDLRELVFNLETGAEPELKLGPRQQLQFPFEVRHRTVVFGGHDTWLKAIRPLLPNVNFVGREVNPSAEMIRHADMVWIQANALAHKRYYKIIDIVRVNDIPVRYFSYASAEKCAMQLAASDEKYVN